MKIKDSGLLASLGKRVLGLSSASSCCTLRDGVEPTAGRVAADPGLLVAEAEPLSPKAAPGGPACCASDTQTSSGAKQSG
jgi:hypothetical protein